MNPPLYPSMFMEVMRKLNHLMRYDGTVRIAASNDGGEGCMKVKMMTNERQRVLYLFCCTYEPVSGQRVILLGTI